MTKNQTTNIWEKTFCNEDINIIKESKKHLVSLEKIALAKDMLRLIEYVNKNKFEVHTFSCSRDSHIWMYFSR